MHIIVFSDFLYRLLLLINQIFIRLRGSNIVSFYCLLSHINNPVAVLVRLGGYQTNLCLFALFCLAVRVDSHRFDNVLTHTFRSLQQFWCFSQKIVRTKYYEIV